MGMQEFFFGVQNDQPTELPNIFPVPINESAFVETEILALYTKILTDTMERTKGLTDEQESLMWDNCVMSNSPDGLITLLAKAMADRKELFLIFDKALNVIRVATNDEQEKIRADYKASAESSLGIFVSFKNYCKSDLIKFYMVLEYCTASSLFKSMNLSKAVQLKMNDLRASVSLTDSAQVKAQAVQIAKALASGKDVLLDAKDEIASLIPDLKAAQSAIEFIAQKYSFYTGLPSAYILGEQTGGLGTTGEGDTKAIERGLKVYFESIFKPVCEALFDATLTYKSQDFRQIAGSIEVLKTFDITSDEYISKDNKTEIINSLFDLPEDATGDAPKKPDPAPIVPAAAGSPQAQPPKAFGA